MLAVSDTRFSKTKTMEENSALMRFVHLHVKGWTTVQFTRIHGGGGLSSPGNVMGALASIFQRAADEVGNAGPIRG